MNKENKWVLFHEVVEQLARGLDTNDIQLSHPETDPVILRNTITSVRAWQKRKEESRAGN